MEFRHSISSTSEKLVLELINVSKTFHILDKRSLTLRNFMGSLKAVNKRRIINALTDINLRIYDGEILGVIGKNGSGKSTLIKVMTRVYKPDKGGKVFIDGKIIRLALGIGFDPNVSARDNIYINGSLLGLTFKTIGNQFDRIIEYAELEDYVNTKVKYFSTGMRARLAFSIAVNANADIFLIDEFFGGVGDIRFKEKSKELFKSAFLKGHTIVFVSHNLDLIQEHCDRVLVLENGKLAGLGDPGEMIELYKGLSTNKGVNIKQQG